MASKKKGQAIVAKSCDSACRKHLRPEGRRFFWKRHRLTERRELCRDEGH